MVEGTAETLNNILPYIQCPQWQTSAQEPGSTVPAGSVLQVGGAAMELQTARMALMRRAVSPCLQELEGMTWI